MASIEVVGDALHLEGYVVGRLSPAIPPSVRGTVEEFFNTASTDEAAVDDALGNFSDDVIKRLKEDAIGGLVTIADVEAALERASGDAS